MLELLNDWILSLGVNENVAFYTTRAVAALAVVILSIAANFVAKRYVLSSLSYIIARTRSKWDDAVLRQRALD
ncbi:MAG: hypothetical protein HKP21_06545, partial [Xanthomonadales bacterium]|nr:hypothetical protein [Gammaproteobacteria bacterium]NNK04194.1 hypothetical protein [Xanthomonadales bacterium]